MLTIAGDVSVVQKRFEGRLNWVIGNGVGAIVGGVGESAVGVVAGVGGIVGDSAVGVVAGVGGGSVTVPLESWVPLRLSWGWSRRRRR